ncbi:glycosyltransferase [bacterium SCSIO 12643]|nr:glycosyltransferase [bacterium SCSIO 12643]
MKTKKTILATTYAVNPFKGSEDGMGWNFVCQIARFHSVIAITRENNREDIERYMQQHPNDIYENITFLYFDLPYWMRFWKKGSRGAMLYYWMWQYGVVSFIRKQNIHFDIVHNLNFHNDWTPSYLWKLNKPFVWGPVGHHPKIPTQYLKAYKFMYQVKDSCTWFVKKLFWNGSIALKNTVKNANHVLCMNTSVQTKLKLKTNQHSIMPSVATEDFGSPKSTKSKKFTLISAGRLVPLKGFDLSILAFASFLKHIPLPHRNDCELIIVGKGPELKKYQDLCKENQILPYVKFIDWIDRKDLMELFRSATAFLFPSHEGAGMVVAEALSFGLPVICLDNEGPGEFIDDSCGFRIPVQSYENTIRDLDSAIHQLYIKPHLLKEMKQNARKKFEESFHWDRRGEALNHMYQNL